MSILLTFVGEGRVAAAHAAATKEFLLIEDVQRDRRFAEGLKWVDAKVALCMPVIKPDGNCYAVLELYRTYSDAYDDVRHVHLTSNYNIIGTKRSTFLRSNATEGYARQIME
jgi:putative methionine-R-sulfoxide reductase with GAF domain